MNVLRYWFRRGLAVIYLAAAAVLTGVFVYYTENCTLLQFLRTLPAVYTLLLLLRTADDRFDYEKDKGRKPQFLTENQLCIQFAVCGILCTALHVLAFGTAGILGIAAVLFIPLSEKFPLLKTVWLAGMFVLYFHLSGTVIGYEQEAVCMVCLAVSVIYAFCKRKLK